MSFWKWSKTASANATADPSVNWAEGMPPSAVNDSGRAMMAAAAKYRDDLAGVIITGGGSTAYTVTTYQNFDSLAHLDGKVIAFTPHATNGEAPTLSVDGLAAKPLRAAHGEPLQSNVLLEGTPYVALYSDGNGEFVLQGMTANPYGIPLAAGMDYWADTTPGSAYAFPKGQAISRTAYAKLFDLVGTKFGPGDGSTTFNLPDKTGRASVMIETAASRLTPTYFGGDSTKIGAVGGSQSHVLTKSELPATPPTGTITNGAITNTVSGGPYGNSSYTAGTLNGSGVWLGYSSNPPQQISVSSSQGASTFAGNNLGDGAPHSIVQPTIACNYIVRII